MRTIIDILFPKLCIGCNAIGSYVCRGCQPKLVVVDDDKCLYCKKDSFMGLTHPGCCRTYGIDGTVSIYRYSRFMQKIVKQIKYRLATAVLEELFQIYQSRIVEKLLFYKRLCRDGLLQPVPLNRQRLKSRGFNQAELIGKFLNKTFRLEPVDCVERTKITLPQADIKEKMQRYQNIKGAFKIKKGVHVRGKTICIIDDVITTGYTVSELARVIKKAGADKVYVITLAAG